MRLARIAVLLVTLPCLARADFPTGGGTNATKIQGVPVPSVGSPGTVLTAALGPSLAWVVPAAGVMLSNATPQNVNLTSGAAGVATTAARADHQHLLPSGIPATKIAGGTVSDTVFGYLAGVTSAIQTQLNALLPATSAKLPPTPSGAGGTLYDNGTNWVRLAPGAANSLYQSNGTAAESWVTALTGITIDGALNPLSNIPGANIIGNIARAQIATALSTGGGAVVGTVLTATTRVETPTIGPASGSQHMIPGGTANILAADSPLDATLLTGTIAAARLPTTTVTAASYPTSGQIPTFTVGVDGRLTASGSTTALTSPVMSGTTTGTYTLAGTPTITSPAISGPTFSGTEGGTRTIGGTPTLGVNLAAGGFKITGLGTASASGDALSYPWITSSFGAAGLATNFTITANSTYQDTGLTLTLPSAGSYEIWCDVRSTIQVSAGAGAVIAIQIFNSSTALYVPSTTRYGAYASSLNTTYTAQTHVHGYTTIASSNILKLHAGRFAGTTFTASTIDTDGSGGFTDCGFTKLSQ